MKSQLGSCEINVFGENNWKVLTYLPMRTDTRMAKIENDVFLIESQTNTANKVLKLNKYTNKWNHVATLDRKRSAFGVSVLNLDGLWKYCKGSIKDM